MPALLKKVLSQSETILARDLIPNETVFITIDMVNGFAKEGNLYSDRIRALIPTISNYFKMFSNCTKLFLNDAHSLNSIEFETFPPHCVNYESKIVDELLPFVDDKTRILEKNSSNAFVSQSFQQWFSLHSENFKNYVVVGDCTDICILQFTTTLKAYFNEKNMRVRIIVPMDGVDTYDMPFNGHDAELINTAALYIMRTGGVEIVKSIQ